ncbi:hypothetical protein H7Y21_00450 [Arenimonas sp.]|nr:hypothetical protein [Candidatus Parcubacteria bacterium]
MKRCGWVIATAIRVTDREIQFRVGESEKYKDVLKFPDLIGQIIEIPMKPKFWKSELRKGRKQFVTFNRTEEVIIFHEKIEYVLLIQWNQPASIRLVGTGSKEDLFRLLCRPSKKPTNPVYEVTIPIIPGFVKGTLEQILDKIRSNCPGDPRTYLTHQDTTWSILAPDGKLKETTMPVLLG